MGSVNKLLLCDNAGIPMVARVLQHVRNSAAHPILVVLGHDATAVRAAFTGREPTFVTAPDHAEGMAASLRAGLAALPATTAAALICLGDMPLVTGAMLDAIIAAHDAAASIVVPTHEGLRGNPVLWPRRYFEELAALSGDIGGRQLLALHARAVRPVPLDHAVLQDFDTPKSLTDWR
jgi:molybdenum cofactor cytidylyltransferase